MSLPEQPPRIGVATSNASMRRALDSLALALQTDAPIVLRAELGSEVVSLARDAHDRGPRSGGPFLSLPCPFLDELPSDRFAECRHGTLFLDEVAALARPLQAKLVHVLDKLSADGTTPRLVSATRRILEQEVGAGRFRQDLFFRVSVVDIRIPPLRERPEDILPLARDLLSTLSIDLGRRPPGLSRDAEILLMGHSWSANVRELKNAVEWALMTWPGDVLEPEAFPEVGPTNSQRRFRVGDDVTLRDLEREHILRVLRRTRTQEDAAAILGVSKSTLWRREIRYQQARAARDQRPKAG